MGKKLISKNYLTPAPHWNSSMVSLKNRQKPENDFGKVSKWYLTRNIVKSTIEVSMQKHY
jgi:16S rRNA A1518/A1519 N6-dimethyltransferase RsmA/KsgA/DIM1 with predicted DNA glycosylase/AP lyase activity